MKRMVLFFIVGLLSISCISCDIHNNSNSNIVEIISAPHQIETEIKATDEIIYTKYFTVTIPNSWKDKYFYEIHSDKQISFFHTKSYDATEGFGHLFTIELKNANEEYMSHICTYIDTIMIEQGEIYDIVVQHPTDVQFTMEYREEYQELENEVQDIIKTISLTNQAEKSTRTISYDEYVHFTGTLKIVNYAINSNNKGSAYILELDEPITCYLKDDFNYNGKTEYTINSIQVDISNADNYVGEHISVSGSVVLAHTGHHIRDIVLLNTVVTN